MQLKRRLYPPSHHLGPTNGKDVELVKNGIGRYEDNILPKPKAGYSQNFGPPMEEAVRQIQRMEKLERTGIINQATFDVIWGCMDAYRRLQYRRFEPPKPKLELIQPKQGWNSLDRSLWLLYSQGRHMGLTDLGTYNPASRLPSGAPSDHAVYPAMAFDLGITPDNGFNNDIGRCYFYSAMHDANCEYVIIGTKIWSRERGLHEYTAGGHMNHVHTSGNR